MTLNNLGAGLEICTRRPRRAAVEIDKILGCHLYFVCLHVFCWNSLISEPFCVFFVNRHVFLRKKSLNSSTFQKENDNKRKSKSKSYLIGLADLRNHFPDP